DHGRLLSAFAHQVADALGLLRALRHPVVDACQVKPHGRLGLAGLGIEEPHLLQALAALALAMVSHHHVEIGIVARTASRETNSHHSSGRGLVSVRATEKSAGFYADQGFGANPLQMTAAWPPG